MDNLTHSLTGALMAKFIETRPAAPEQKVSLQRTFFWLFLLAANLPDIDVIIGFIGDPSLSIRYHRGITHSLLFAPVFAFLPAILFHWFSKVKNIRILWIVSLLGIVLHIFFDLVTSYGTQILLPLSETRYSLDWLFIVDPIFTSTIALFLLVSRFLKKRKSLVTSIGIAMVVLYVITSAFNHGIALTRVYEGARKSGVSWSRISAIPQPLSIFKWQGLVQTDSGVLQSFFSVLDDREIQFAAYPQDDNEFVRSVLESEDAEWFLQFARHPSVTTYEKDGVRFVELRDMMFSIDENLTRSLGFTERSGPFVLSYEFDSAGRIRNVMFDGEVVRDAKE